MKNKNKFIGIALIVTAVLLVFWFQGDSTDLIASDDSNTNNSTIQEEKIAPDNHSKTIASEWQWSQSPSAKEAAENTSIKEINSLMAQSSASAEALPFTEKSVRDALQEVRIDESGNIILDNTALMSLDEALERIYKQLDDTKLEKLVALIEAGLPGLAGEQTAELVENYVGFLKAKDEFSQIYENQEVPAEQTVESLERDESLYQELGSLRETYLGKEKADQLFKITDANANYMFDTLKISANDTLTPEERSQQLKEIQERHALATIDIPNWTYRYDSFLAEKETILNAAISDDEKQNQLTALLRDRFNERERSTIEHLALDVL